MRARAILALVAMLGLSQPGELTATFWVDQPTACALDSHGCRHHQRMTRSHRAAPAGSSSCHRQAAKDSSDESVDAAPTMCSCSSETPGAVTATGHPPFEIVRQTMLVRPASPFDTVLLFGHRFENPTAAFDPPPPRHVL